METITFNNIIPVIIYVIIIHGFIPIVNKMLPEKQAARSRLDQAAFDRDTKIKDREVAALESLSLTNKEIYNSIVSINERQAATNQALTAILSTMHGHTNALNLLVDRLSRTPPKRKTTARTRKGE
jgi:acetylglutamate kinase